VLSAGNTLIIVLLGEVLALQVRETAFCVLWREEHRSHDSLSPSPPPFFFFRGQEWARRLETREVAKIAAEEEKEWIYVTITTPISL
jgi:hypothetical protein